MNATQNSMLTCLYWELPVYDESLSVLIVAILTIILNCISCIFATMGNGVIIWTLIKVRSLHTPSNILLGCLSVCDLLVAVLCQPLFVIRRVSELTGYPYRCPVIILYQNFPVLFSGWSFLTLLAVCLERWVAIFRPFRHHRLSHLHVLSVVAFLWLVGGLATFSRFMGLSHKSFTMLTAAIVVITFLTASVVYAQIFLLARAQRKQINDLQRNVSTHRNAQKEREAKMSRTMAIIVGVWFCCFLPELIVMTATSAVGSTPVISYIAHPIADTIVYLNSCMNFSIYCLRQNDIRRALARTVRRQTVVEVLDGMSNFIMEKHERIELMSLVMSPSRSKNCLKKKRANS